jgi:hypothetical protein
MAVAARQRQIFSHDGHLCLLLDSKSYSNSNESRVLIKIKIRERIIFADTAVDDRGRLDANGMSKINIIYHSFNINETNLLILIDLSSF